MALGGASLALLVPGIAAAEIREVRVFTTGYL